MSKDLIIDKGYAGYTVVGWAEGFRDPMDHEKERGLERVPYYILFVVSPVSGFRSDNYQASGFKAQKLSCLSPVWTEAGLNFGDKVKLFFDKKEKVVMAAIDN